MCGNELFDWPLLSFRFFIERSSAVTAPTSCRTLRDLGSRPQGDACDSKTLPGVSSDSARTRCLGHTLFLLREGMLLYTLYYRSTSNGLRLRDHGRPSSSAFAFAFAFASTGYKLTRGRRVESCLGRRKRKVPRGHSRSCAVRPRVTPRSMSIALSHERTLAPWVRQRTSLTGH